MKNPDKNSLAYFFVSYNHRRISINPVPDKHCLLYTFVVFIFFIISGELYSQQKSSNINPQGVSPKLEKQVRNTLKQNSRKLQLEENNGQYGLSPNVIAYFSSNNQIVFIEKDRLRVIILDPENKKSSLHSSVSAGKNSDPLPDKYHYNSFCIKFKGSDGISRFEKGKPFETIKNYVESRYSKKGLNNVRSYDEITLKDVYKGIDLRLYSQESGHLEFDWIVWPGADPDNIRMKFEGQKKIHIAEAGNLEIILPLGKFNMHLPESYYSTPRGKKVVDFKFAMPAKNEVSFKQKDKHNDQYPLVIDPDLMWGTFFDGGSSSFDEYLYAIEFNSSNQLLYCAGVTNRTVSTSYVAALSSGYDGSFNSNRDVIIYALTKNGSSITYSTLFGGSSDDVATGVSISGSNIFVCGYTQSSSASFPVTNGSGGTTAAFDNSLGGNQDGFVAVLNEALNQLNYCTYLGGTSGSSDDVALTIRATGSNSFYVSLSLQSSLPTSSPNYLVSFADNNFGGSEEAWIAKFTSFSTLRFGTYVGGSDIDVVNDFQLLSDGDVVFAGSSNQITEINDNVSDNSSSTDVLFGRINVPASGSVSFTVLERIGGSGTDNGFGILALGDSVSVIVGQTNSSNFPKGSGTPFQGTLNGDYDGFIARINNDGTGEYKAGFVGGTGKDLLVSARPVIMNNTALVLCFGATQSTDLSVINFNEGSLYSGTNAGGWDILFLICDFNVSSKYYLSYLGGSANDYLGATGVPKGSNHVYYNSVDSVLYVGTTTHSNQSTQQPIFIGRGIADAANIGVPVFDSTKSNSNDDTHVIFAISSQTLYALLDVKWQSLSAALNSDCSINLKWAVTDEYLISNYIIERSTDGHNFDSIARVAAGNQFYVYADASAAGYFGKMFYRIRYVNYNGHISYSKTIPVKLCDARQPGLKIYPTITRSEITIDGFNFSYPQQVIIQMYNSFGKLMTENKMNISNGPVPFHLSGNFSTGNYFLAIRESQTGKMISCKKIIIFSH